MKSIPYGKQSISLEDISAVDQVLNSDWLTQGPKIAEFESLLADYCGSKYAVVLSSGTAALHVANLALGVQKNTNVLTSPISFVATSNSVIYAGGTPVFCDIEETTFNVSPLEIEALLSKRSDISGIIPVHLGGLVADMEAISDIAKRNGLWVIEDACHALGGRWTDSTGVERKVGDCSFSDLTVFSFHPVKHITTGEGGAITTNSEIVYNKLIELRTHGITRDATKLRENHGGWYYEIQNLGYNYRITDFQAALGINQLKKSDKWSERRLEIVHRYDEAFKDISELSVQIHPSNKNLCYHLYITQVKKRKELYEFLQESDIHTQVHYIPIHLQPYYQDTFGFRLGDFPKAEKYYEHALSLPLFPTMSNVEQDRVIKAVKDFYRYD
jgi:UDP-4-amino-4,6-dideoxy-N-acetyl-beta-L-altrosamine transaminase